LPLDQKTGSPGYGHRNQHQGQVGGVPAGVEKEGRGEQQQPRKGVAPYPHGQYEKTNGNDWKKYQKRQ
jgi:hypothetical protein